MRRRRTQAGLTLIEILVVLAIIVGLTIALAVGYKRLTSTALRREAVHMAAVMHAAYDGALASNAYHRIIFDLDERTYVLQKCEGKIALHRAVNQKEEEEAKKLADEKAQEEKDNGQTPEQAIQAELLTAGNTMGGAGGGASASCSPIKGELGKPQKLGNRPRVKFAKIYVGHLDQPAEKGKVTLNFFPMGQAERAVIELAIGEDNAPLEIWSLAVHGLTGRVELEKGPWKNPEDFVGSDAEGKRQNP